MAGPIHGAAPVAMRIWRARIFFSRCDETHRMGIFQHSPALDQLHAGALERRGIRELEPVQLAGEAATPWFASALGTEIGCANVLTAGFAECHGGIPPQMNVGGSVTKLPGVRKDNSSFIRFVRNLALGR